MLKPKEEESPEIKDLSVEIGNVLIEGAKVHENSLVLLTSSKKAYIINNLSDIKAEVVCDESYGKFC